MIDILDDVTHVRDALQEYGGFQKTAGSNVHVLCPFHSERSPSCSINLGRGGNIGVGTFFCFGCGEHGHWNKFAAATNLPRLKNYQSFERDSKDSSLRFMQKQMELMGQSNRSIQRLFDEVGNAVIPWPIERPWRSYSGKLIRRIGGYCYNDPNYDELMLVLPVYINGKYRGGVRAFFEKQDNGLSYLTLKGDWVKSYGLLGFDYVQKKSLWGARAVVVVEGPRDWLRLIRNKIPAVAILGAKMMDDKKMTLLASLGVKKVFACPDNDRAGKSMASMVEKYAKAAGLKFEYLRLPAEKDKDGKLIKMDPDNAPVSIIKEIKELVYAV